MRLLQFLLLFWFFYALVKLLRGSARRRPPQPDPEKTPAGEEMIQDPYCGTYVPRSLAVPLVVDRQTYHFCSEKCRDAYRDSH
jgi:YHS domain-containing protein